MSHFDFFWFPARACLLSSICETSILINSSIQMNIFLRRKSIETHFDADRHLSDQVWYCSSWKNWCRRCNWSRRSSSHRNRDYIRIFIDSFRWSSSSFRRFSRETLSTRRKTKQSLLGVIKSMRTSILGRLIDNVNYFNFQIFYSDSIASNLVRES